MSKANASISPKFLDPYKIMGQIALEEGATVADFGCASGYFSIPFAREVGEEGRVYSLDVLPQAIERVESHAKSEGLANIKTKRVNLENDNGSGLGESSCDWVVMKDVLFQNKKIDKIIKEAYRILRKEGRLLVIEWDEYDFSIGPQKDIRITKEKLVSMIEEQGFKVESNIEAGDFHYGVVAVK